MPDDAASQPEPRRPRTRAEERRPRRVAGEPRLLIVEDDSAFSEFLRVLLETHGYLVTLTSTAEKARDLVPTLMPSLIVLDLRLPGMGGLQFLSELRRTLNYDGLVMVVSGLIDELTKVQALRLGADDYVAKPVGSQEFVARVQALLRRYHPIAAVRQVNLGGLEIDLGARRVSLHGQAVRLTRKEFQILACLAGQQGVVRSPSEILTEAWGPQFVHYVQTLRIHVGHLRQKLAAIDPSREYIRTVPGVGYGLNA